MAQLTGALRITLTGVSVQTTESLLPWKRVAGDAATRFEFRAEDRTGLIAEGAVTREELRWWSRWFTSAGEVRALSSKLGKAPADPVARLWTPLAGQTVEFFVWPEASGGLALLALFTPDGTSPRARIAVECSTTTAELAAFATSLEQEADSLSKA